MFLTECREGRSSVGGALPGSEDALKLSSCPVSPHGLCTGFHVTLKICGIFQIWLDVYSSLGFLV